jgi:ABC-type multidrug transport system fused ATPase/permease subunit
MSRLGELMSFELVDGGSNLSLGQRQLICLGRVLLQRCELILVDEATAAVDPVTEAILYEVLGRQLEVTGSTLVMICHKQSGVHRLCTQMLEMRDGCVLSFGDIVQSDEM